MVEKLAWIVLFLGVSTLITVYRKEIFSFISRHGTQRQKGKREAWEIPGARTHVFKLYEAACYLAGACPSWPLPEGAKEEYYLLLRALEGGKLDHLDPVVEDVSPYSFAVGWDDRHMLELDRPVLREYLRLEGRPIAAFLEERFDDWVKEMGPEWRRGFSNRPLFSESEKTCSQWVDLYTVDFSKDRLDHDRLEETAWFLQSTFYGPPPTVVRSFSEVRYGCGYGIVIWKEPETVTRILREADWIEHSNLTTHNCRHISMGNIREVLTSAGLVDG